MVENFKRKNPFLAVIKFGNRVKEYDCLTRENAEDLIASILVKYKATNSIVATAVVQFKKVVSG